MAKSVWFKHRAWIPGSGIVALVALIGLLIEQAFWWPVRRHWRSGARANT
jgi:hypothetical protein